MSANPFEKKTGEWLSAVPNAWVHHPVDVPHAHVFAPCDFIVLLYGRLIAIECKQVSTYEPFPFSRWTPQQRQCAEGVRRAGGRYILLVDFKRVGLAYAYEPLPGVGRGSLKPGDGRTVTKQTIYDELIR